MKTNEFDKKYRWKTLEKIIGNEDTIKVLSKLKSLPSSTLFVGPSGCGKTTIARILGNTFDLNLMELNLSNQRGIDNARAILEDIKLNSLFEGKGKLIVLDECHKATNDFQNAILKALEEPPQGVHFILCTTDPNKLIKAIKTRQRPYLFKKLTPEESRKLIHRIAKKEDIEIKKSNERKIMQAADGIPRSILIILDQIKDLKSDKEISSILENYSFINDEAEESVLELCRALHKGAKYSEVMNIVKQLLEGDMETIRHSVMKYMRSILLSKQDKRAALVMDCFSEPFYNGANDLVKVVYLIYS